MRKMILCAVLALACATAQAQNGTAQYRDSLVYRQSAQVDSSLVGSNIFSTMPAGVNVRQSPAIRSAMFGHVERNADRMFTGFRIRIFNESVQNARSMSEAAESRFRTLYPSMASYLTYSSPYFKVTVGDFRTRAEAEKAIRTIRGDFPDAVIVKERFKYPSFDGGATMRADTVRIFR